MLRGPPPSDTIENPLALLAMVFVGVANFFGLNIILAVSASCFLMGWLLGHLLVD